MTDNDLLKFAAEAMGIELDWDKNEYDTGPPPYRSDKVNCSWNPLINNSDAFCLAVALGMWVYCGSYVSVDCRGRLYEENAMRDAFAATRRAIVRAAAGCILDHNSIK